MLLVSDGIIPLIAIFNNQLPTHHVQCWYRWGRGILFTRGICNFGRLNHYLGRKAAGQGFLNYYDIDFCVYPQIVCEDTRALKWDVGYFEWADRVQTYQNTAEGLD